MGVAIVFYGLGLFTALFLYAWLDERSDRYAGIVIPPEQPTCISWEFRKPDLPTVYPVRPVAQRTRGHLGHLDHKATQRLRTWIEDIESAPPHRGEPARSPRHSQGDST